MQISKLLKSVIVISGLITPLYTYAKPISEEELDNTLVSMLEEKPVVGLAVAIIEEGKLKYIRTYGYRNLKTKEPVNKDTVFRLGSVSKPMSAGLASLLAYENKINLEQNIKSISKNVSLPPNSKNKPITLKNTLSHTSGIDIWANVLIEGGYSREKQLKSLKLYKNDCLPGKCYRYNNILFSIIKEATDNIAKNNKDTSYANFNEAMANRIFNPLGMSKTSAGTKEFLNQSNIALPYDRVNGSYSEFVEANINPYYDTVVPAAGFNSTISDMAKWLIAQMGYTPNIIPQQSLSPLFDKIAKTNVELKRFNSDWRIKHLKSAHYGLGWRIYDFSGHEIIFHPGNLAGVATAVAFSKETNSGIVVLSNTDSGLASSIVARFFEITLEV